MIKEISLSEEQIERMAIEAARIMEKKIKDSPVFLVASDSYGAILHRTWIFTIDTDLVIGSVERYWDGLKMICSVLKGSPRTYFFTANGERSNAKDLKKNGQEKGE